MIYGIFGDIGEGKTIIMIGKYLKKYYDNNYQIFYNGSVKFPYKKINIDWLLDMVERNLAIPDNMVIAIDEIAVGLMDSRLSSSKINRILSYLFLMSRKLKADFYYTSQFPSLIDQRLWNLTKVKIFCKLYEIGTYKFVVLDKKTRIGSRIITEKEVVFINPYFDLYDTNEIIRLPVTDRYDKKPILKIDKKQSTLI
jgi:hypothetical protein